jgi:hypothetical protein
MVVAAASRVDGDLLGLLGKLGPAPEQPGLKSLPENGPPPGRMATRLKPGKETPREADDGAGSAAVYHRAPDGRPPRSGWRRRPLACWRRSQANGYAWVKSVRKLAALLAPLGLGREDGRPVRLAYPPTGRRTGWLDLPLAERVSCRTQGIRHSAHPMARRG